jgi:hypothetical protein
LERFAVHWGRKSNEETSAKGLKNGSFLVPVNSSKVDNS